MKILALEFSSPQRTVAVADSATAAHGHVTHELVASGAGLNRCGAMVEETLRTAKFERAQIECVAVGLGPGSYTGIRAAIAWAQGWQLAREVKLAGISSADGIAIRAQEEGLTGRVAVVIDAQREEFYLATYSISAHRCELLSSLRIVTLSEIRDRERAGEVLIGPEVTRWFPSGRLVFPRAAALARLISERNEFVSGEKLEPIYLRETTFSKAKPPRILPDV